VRALFRHRITMSISFQHDATTQHPPQDVQQAQGFVLERLQQQAVRVGTDAAAMPGRVATIDRCLLMTTPVAVSRDHHCIGLQTPLLLLLVAPPQR